MAPSSTAIGTDRPCPQAVWHLDFAEVSGSAVITLAEIVKKFSKESQRAVLRAVWEESTTAPGRSARAGEGAASS